MATAFNVNLGNSNNNWVNGSLNTNTSNYKGQSVTGLQTNGIGLPLAWTVALSHQGEDFTVTFSGGTQKSSTESSGSVQISSQTGASTTTDTWDASATNPEGENSKAKSAY